MKNSRHLYTPGLRVCCFVIWSVLASSSYLLMPIVAGAACETGRQLYEQAIGITDTEARIRLLRQSLEECQEFNVFYELGLALLAKGELAEAQSVFEQAGNLPELDKVGWGKALVALGSVYERQGHLGEAITSYRQALRLHDFPKVAKHLFSLEVERSKSVIPAAEISRSLTMTRSYGVAAGMDLPVQFEYNQAILNRSGREQAAQLGEALIDEAFADGRFVLLGHTDLRGPEEYNLELSRQRAEAVKQFLVLNYPLDASRIKTEGFGESQPLYNGDSEEVHRLNRRVEVRVE